MMTWVKRLRSHDFDTVAIATIAVVALLTELIILRFVTRTAIHIPGLGTFETEFRLLSELGRIAFNAAVILVFALLVAMIIDAAVKTRWPLLVALVGFLVVAIAAPFGWLPEALIDSVTIIVIVAAPLLGWFSGEGSLRRSISPLLFSSAFAVAAVPTVVGKAQPETTLPVSGMLNVAEALALAAAFSLLIRVWGQPQRRSLVIAVVVGGLTAGMLAAQPATIEILMLWNLGLAGYFSPMVYGVAAAVFAYAAATSIRRGQPTVALGIAFVIAGGIGLHSTIQSASFLIGVLLLAYPDVIRRPVVPISSPVEQSGILTTTGS